jgi:hypothetical protein
MNIRERSSTHQPTREPWSIERLQRARAAALGAALEPATTRTYTSALLSYTTFCDLHNRPYHPTLDTLSFYIVFMSAHIQPASVSTYLSGICAELEGYWPEVREIRNSRLITRILAGCYKIYRSPPTRKQALTEEDLRLIQRSIPVAPSLDDALFMSLCFVGWHCLMRLGELVDNDSASLQSFRKAIRRSTVKFSVDPRLHASFHLPMHKADRLFEGSTIVLEQREGTLDPLLIFKTYLTLRDSKFPHLPDLWLCDTGKLPLL